MAAPSAELPEGCPLSPTHSLEEVSPPWCGARGGAQRAAARLGGMFSGSGQLAPALSLSVVAFSSRGVGTMGIRCDTVTEQLVPGSWSRGFLFASLCGPTQSLWGPVPGEADQPTGPCGASAAFCSNRAHCVCGHAHRWPCAPAAPHSLRVHLLCSLENATNSADAASSKFVFGQNMSERVLVSDPVGMTPGAQRRSEPPAGHRGTWRVAAVSCPVALECFLLPRKRKKTQLRLSLNSMQGREGQAWWPGEALREPGLSFLSLLISGQGGDCCRPEPSAVCCWDHHEPPLTPEEGGPSPTVRPQHGVGGGVAASDRPPQCPLHSKHAPRVIFWPRMGFWNCHLLPYFFPFIPQPYIPNPVVSICEGGSGAVGGSPDSWHLGLCL